MGTAVGSQIIFSSIFGALMLDEVLAAKTLATLIILAVLVALLGFERSAVVSADTRARFFGLLCGLAFGACSALGQMFLARTSRDTDALAAGYFWEFLIGVVLAVSVVLHARLRGRRVPVVSGRKFLSILWRSAPTALGTACYVSALNFGPVAVLNGLASGIIVVSSLLAVFLYHERPDLRQWLTMLVIVGLIVLLGINQEMSIL